MRNFWSRIFDKTLYERLTEKRFNRMKAEAEYELTHPGMGPMPKPLKPSLFEKATESEYQRIRTDVAAKLDVLAAADAKILGEKND